MRTCSVCGEEKPLDAFYQRKGSPDGYRTDCKGCTLARNRRWGEANRERRNAVQRAYVAANPEKRQAWEAAHPEAKKKHDQSYYERNKERIKERVRARYAADRETIKERQRAYGAEHAEEKRARTRDWNAANPERGRASRKAWRQANPDKRNEYDHRRRAQKRGTQVEPVNPRAIYERDKGICQICRRPVDPKAADPMERPSLDHIIPLSRRGPHTPWNVQLTHWRCNVKRGTGRIPAQLRIPL